MQWGKGAGYLLLFLLLSVATLASANDTYRSSVTGLFDNTTYQDDAELKLFALGLQFFYLPVSIDKGPYEEAAFLDRQTNLGISMGTLESTFSGESINGNAFFLTGVYADQALPYTFGLNYSAENTDDSVSGVDVEITIDIVSFELGYYINPHSRLLFDIGQTKTETRLGGSLSSKSDANTYGLMYKNVLLFHDSHAANIEAGFEITDQDNGDQETVVSLLLDNYLNEATSISVGSNITRSDDPASEGISVIFGVQSFVKKMTAIGLMFENFSANRTGNDDETITVTVEHRIN